MKIEISVAAIIIAPMAIANIYLVAAICAVLDLVAPRRAEQGGSLTGAKEGKS